MANKINYEDIWQRIKRELKKTIDKEPKNSPIASTLNSLLLGMYTLEDASREAKNGK